MKHVFFKLITTRLVTHARPVMQLLPFLFLLFRSELSADCLCTKEVNGSNLDLASGNRGATVVGSPGGPFLSVDSSSGNFFVLSTDTNDTASGDQFDTQTVRGRIFDALGHALLASPIVFETGPYSTGPFATAGAAAYNGSQKQFFVTWLVRFRDGTLFGRDIRQQLRAQIVSSDGTTVKSKFVLTQVNPDNVSLAFHDVLYNAKDHEYVLLYSFMSRDATKQTLFVQRLDSSGVKIGKPVIVNQDRVGSIRFRGGATIKRDTNLDRYFVLWNLEKSATVYSSRNLFQLFTAQLQRIGSNGSISSQSSRQGPAKLVYSAGLKKFVLLWNNDFTKTEIEARTITSNGIFGPEFRVAGIGGYLNDVRLNPKSHGFLVLYQKFVGPIQLQQQALMVGRLAQNLTTVDKDVYVTCDLGTNVGPGTIAYNSARTEFLAVWPLSINDSPPSYDIYGQRIRAVPAGKCSAS